MLESWRNTQGNSMACAQEEENSRILVITVGLLISCIFLAATLATYCCLPALQNLHGKTLMCHVSSLLVAYLFLALTQLLTKPVFLHNEWVCSIIGWYTASEQQRPICPARSK